MNEAVYREILRRLGIDLPLSPETQCGRGPTSPAGWVHSGAARRSASRPRADGAIARRGPASDRARDDQPGARGLPQGVTVVRHLAHDLQDFARFASPAGGGTGAPDHRPGDPVAARAQCAGGLPRARHVRACHGLAEGRGPDAGVVRRGPGAQAHHVASGALEDCRAPRAHAGWRTRRPDRSALGSLRVPDRGPRHGALPVRLPPGRAAHRRLPQGLGHGLFDGRRGGDALP